MGLLFYVPRYYAVCGPPIHLVYHRPRHPHSFYAPSYVPYFLAFTRSNPAIRIPLWAFLLLRLFVVCLIHFTSELSCSRNPHSFMRPFILHLASLISTLWLPIRLLQTPPIILKYVLLDTSTYYFYVGTLFPLLHIIFMYERLAGWTSVTLLLSRDSLLCISTF